MKDFKDKVAVVTGAASGIGRGLAETFIEVGMKVMLADIEEENLKKTAQALRDDGADVADVVVDVSKPELIEMLAQKTIDAYGAVHILCNNAGVGYSLPNCWEISHEAWQWVIGVNLMGVINGVRVFMPLMLEQDTEAHIVNTSSVEGLFSVPGNAPYRITKHAIVAFSEALYLNLLVNQSKVKVSVLCPGPTNTDIMNSIERVRPYSVPAPPDPPPEAGLFIKAMSLFLERGMSPREVGRLVMDAIKEEQFYIITQDINEEIERRMRGILDRKNPKLGEPPKEIMDIVQELMSSGPKGTSAN